MVDFTNNSALDRIVVLCLAMSFFSSLAKFEDKFAGEVTAQTSTCSQEVSNPKSLTPGLLASHPDAGKVWEQFIARNHYRLASTADSKLSVDDFRAYGDGDFNGDGAYSDFAVIVVDTTRIDASRFGLVIFNARKRSRGYEGPFWLYKGVDLSTTSLSLISHGPLLVAKNGDHNAACIVKWNRRKKSYGCV